MSANSPTSGQTFSVLHAIRNNIRDWLTPLSTLSSLVGSAILALTLLDPQGRLVLALACVLLGVTVLSALAWLCKRRLGPWAQTLGSVTMLLTLCVASVFYLAGMQLSRWVQQRNNPPAVAAPAPAQAIAAPAVNDKPLARAPLASPAVQDSAGVQSESGPLAATPPTTAPTAATPPAAALPMPAPAAAANTAANTAATTAALAAAPAATPVKAKPATAVPAPTLVSAPSAATAPAHVKETRMVEQRSEPATAQRSDADAAPSPNEPRCLRITQQLSLGQTVSDNDLVFVRRQCGK